ncbi:hypothetical protein KY289_019702 [Solanum tuberosum]|nr:hypothetical protein KY289_019702 [Solanum tuberosum]
MGLLDLSKKRLQMMREDEWDSMMDEVSLFCGKHGISIPKMNEDYSNGNSKLTSDLLLGMASLCPVDSFANFHKDRIMKLAEYYPSKLGDKELRELNFQLDDFIVYAQKCDSKFLNLKGIKDLAKVMIETKQDQTWSLVYLLVKLTLIIPVATASVERAFSSMKYIKNDLRNRMDEDILNECKYLVVVDGVWQKEAWESLKRAFPDRNNGSTVIITTRKVDVAERADNRGFVHKLRFLSPEESWTLFGKKLVDVRAMVPAMESLAKDMVGKCRGLPLAIVVLSGLLSHRWGLDKWQNVKDYLWKDIEEDSIEISYILSLSFNDLSAALKKCFLYFGVFPED